MPAKPGLVKGSEKDLDNQIEEDHLADLKLAMDTENFGVRALAEDKKREAKKPRESSIPKLPPRPQSAKKSPPKPEPQVNSDIDNTAEKDGGQADSDPDMFELEDSEEEDEEQATPVKKAASRAGTGASGSKASQGSKKEAAAKKAAKPRDTPIAL